MKVLELFAGTRSIGKAFETRGHEVFSVEWDKRFENINLYKDILTLSAAEVLEKFGRPDVIWASPDCTTYSIAAISHQGRHEKNGFYERAPSVHCDLLQIRRYKDEADRHMDKSPRPGFFANVPQWRPLPRAGSSGSKNRNAGTQGRYGEVNHTPGLMRPYRRDMRERGLVTW